MSGKSRVLYKEEAKTKPFLMVVLFLGLAYGLYHGIQDNYLAEIVSITEFERGVVEFFREIPGLVLVFVLALMYRFTETKVLKISIGILMVGLVGLLLAGTNKFFVILVMVLYSLGEHLMIPVKSSISLSMAKQGKGGASLGITSSVAHAGRIGGYLAVTGLFLLFGTLGIPSGSITGFRIVMVVTGVLILLSYVLTTAIKGDGQPVRRSRIYFHRKFATYYMLEVFYGARKQIFLTFAPYVLILHYGADTSVISLLLAVCAGFGMLLSPWIGRLVDRMGYKFVMVTDTLLLMVVCFFYGFAHRLFPPEIAFIVVCVNFVLDSVISLASLASNVYVQAVASSPEEVTATITTGISVNHLISVTIAFAGGLIWQKLGIEVLFAASGILGLINTLFAASIKKPVKSV